MRDAAAARTAATAHGTHGPGAPAGDGAPGPAGSGPDTGDPVPAGGGPGEGPGRTAEGYAAARVRLLQDTALSGPDRRRALAGLTDRWLAGLFTAKAPTGTALVAVGGYGHGELSPRSDLDLLLLHDGTTDTAALAALADHLWYPVWDLGLALDHSVRTLGEARAAAEDDLKVQLGLLDARHVAGDQDLTAQLRTAALARWRAQARSRLPELREYAGERARRHGELRFLLEPDLKEARGGLRDLTALRAVAASWLADAPREGLREARDTLLDVRDALHLTTGRATDRLALQDQDQVATALGLLDSDTLLRRVYEAAGAVGYASDVTWREVERVLRARGGTPRGTRLRGLLGGGRRTGGRPGAPVRERTPLAEGVVEHEGEAALALHARPDRDPVLPLRAAAAAAQAGVPLALPAVRKLARSAPPLPVPWPAEAREEFVTLLGAGEATVPVWEAMDAAGLITRLLPDWERVRCRPQRNPVHRYTVDRHLVETAVRAAALTRRVHRPDLLLTGALLHDIGKGWPGDHSVTGETIAGDLAARIGFDAADTRTLATLVRHHLLLVETATRRNLDDPATIRSVAEAVGSPGTLELLHALTEADALATGPAAWSSWRATLVSDLVSRVAAVLAGEPVADRTADRELTAEGERLAMEAWRTGGPVLALRTHKTGHTGGEGAAAVPGDGGADGGPEPVGVELSVALPEQSGVLPAVAGVLALHKLTVRAADLRLAELPAALTEGGSTAASDVTAVASHGTTVAGDFAAAVEGGSATAETPRVLLLTWRVAAQYGSLPQAARLREDLVRALDGSLGLALRLAEREAAYRPRRTAIQPPPPRATVAPGDSAAATVIEVRAQDAPGLLHRIGQALEEAGVRVRSAHVSTLGANAVDAFYVTDAAGVPLSDVAAARLAQQVETALR
ncbi:[protein-PII] uridylyltransferase [Streptomyces smyrnaeus]|uniref:Bifunctional uridylyltransferase/uridylyl-removing enzyme n=1 Tax=Streptomyces smyrnaeus TaxID=1387713 RepID=A0ABS3Y2Q4_9ACTN|nr:[protein-PII] uridylyltransferase [Streptomyces smyrnaeus]MBO8201886.1 [protein-PII] uridylyltransferase [Streptomyces smyrnaeus]